MDVDASPLVEDELRKAPARQLERSIHTASITRVAGVNLLDLKGESGEKEEAPELQKKIEWPVSGQPPGTYAGPGIPWALCRCERRTGHLEFCHGAAETLHGRC